jgi:hypothetical protein
MLPIGAGIVQGEGIVEPVAPSHRQLREVRYTVHAIGHVQPVPVHRRLVVERVFHRHKKGSALPQPQHGGRSVRSCRHDAVGDRPGNRKGCALYSHQTAAGIAKGAQTTANVSEAPQCRGTRQEVSSCPHQFYAPCASDIRVPECRGWLDHSCRKTQDIITVRWTIRQRSCRKTSAATAWRT